MATPFAAVAPLFATDAYKLGHRHMSSLAGNVTRVYSNYTNRKAIDASTTHVVHFGLQAFITKNLMDGFAPFFEADVDEVCDLYERRVAMILGPDNNVGSDHIRALHALGYLPLRFCAVPEGTPVPIKVPSFTVENTHPDFAWLTNYVEPALSAGVWHPSTSATIAYAFRRQINAAAERTTGQANHPATDFQLHDFSYRGQTSDDAAAGSGAGHLLSSNGTDSLIALEWIDRYYGGEYTAMSVPATEHSVMSELISSVGEREGFKRLLRSYPSGILSVVSDTFDLWRCLLEYLPSLHEEVVARDGKLVIRPDSGDPVDIVCGLNSRPGVTDSAPRTPELDPAHFGVVELLWREFGGTVNEAGLKELDPHIGVIYGDSITRERAAQIVERLESKGFASTNVVFGIGSFTYQFVTRDTFGSAIKATWAKIDGEGHNLFKNPVTDSGTKRSATGRLAVKRDAEGELYLIEQATPADEAESALQPVWQDGAFLRHQDFADVRRTLWGE